ncbi:MAG: transcription-repair coupling factor [Bacteroidetes bacterium]|jgi:transcription-repair coupling factor (superfamily II helicase)|nr:transcription-repair coupling factor [Bacteroidota bacterium]
MENHGKLLHIYSNHPLFSQLTESLQANKPAVLLKGLSGSSKNLLLAEAITVCKNVHLIVALEKDAAAYIYSDLLNYFDKDQLKFFPSGYKRSVQYQQTDPESIIQRTDVLQTLNTYSAQVSVEPLIIVTYPEALIEKVISQQKLIKNTLEIKSGDSLSIDFVNEVLHEYQFKRVDFVYEPGQYSIRGSIVDIFSYANDLPFRIDFFGDEVESIRSFDLNTQLSQRKFEKLSIIPNVQDAQIEQTREIFLDHFPKNLHIWTPDTGYIKNKINELYDSTDQSMLDETSDLAKTVVLATGNQLLDRILTYPVIEYGNYSNLTDPYQIDFDTAPQPAFNKSFELLGENLAANTEKGYTNFIVSESEKQIERLESIFTDIGHNVVFKPVLCSLHEGFTDHTLQICCYTDHQIFERYHRHKVSTNFNRKESLTLKELSSLQPGDYVVHIDHGIGKFGGLDKIDVNGKRQEAVRLIYRDNDILYVSIHSLHRISKYKGKDGDAPRIYKLGSGAWQKLKQNTKKKVKDIAKELIALYAKRKEEKGYAFSTDSYLQKELEASFFFEDTPDQEKSTKAVKEDMENAMPMDRLVCGDVGFGKTEIAVRAAFKAVTDSKQVAILVPTTILALQHYKTFTDRLKDFPCNIAYISRLKKAKEQREILSKLEKGEVDILIGTHRLLGKDIKFHDLGLLIVDEEQKFGVSAKEKLRALKINVDTLTLTATPIPRTLQFSLMGARDLSILHTPPPNRHPIITELHTFNEDIIREGIFYEVNRGGQVFFIHNRIQNISEIQVTINRVCPGVKTIVAHGQMEGKQLEQIMLDYINGDYDVLIATTIIESGLDIPNANTIFINNAQNFGLSDLHQLRGRVGRSNTKAFCYLLAPPLSVLPGEARRRLNAIEEFSDLGSGFNIAMQDLDIRGAGNLLGAEQSGYISDIGFETYHRILDEAVMELKETEFKDLFTTDEKKDDQPKNFLQDSYIDTDFEMHFPEDYINNVSERIRLYRELDNIENEEDLQQFEASLVDRFGEIPQVTKDLFMVVRLRWKAIRLGFEKIILKNQQMIIHFISDQSSEYYQTYTFQTILQYVQSHPKQFKMKEEKDKLIMTTRHIPDIYEAYKLVDNITA